MSGIAGYGPRRRHLLRAALAIPLAALAGPRGAAAQGLAAVNHCARATPASSEGPFFKAGSPQRASLLAPGDQGVKLSLTGVVRSRACEPVQGALLDFWHADLNGHYDMAGFTLRGHQLTDAVGRYRLETVVPARYPGRTRHIHVKLQRPGGSLLTTELYFPDEASNQADRQFTDALLIDLTSRTGDREDGKFDFVLA